MLLLDQMSGGRVVGRNVFSTTFLLFPLTYAHAFSLPSSSPEGHRSTPVLFPPPFVLTRKKVFGTVFCLPRNYRSTIQDKVHGYGNARCTFFNCLTSSIVELMTSPNSVLCYAHVRNFWIEISCVSKFEELKLLS